LKRIKRAKDILSVLYTPSLPKRMDVLVEQEIIIETQNKTWKKDRPYLAQGNIQISNHSIRFYFLTIIIKGFFQINVYI